MTQVERDRLVTLRKTQKRLITRAQAAEELGLSVRQVKRLVKELKNAAIKQRSTGCVAAHRITG